MDFDGAFHKMQRAVDNMREVSHAGLYLNGNGFWDLSETKKRRAVDETDVDELRQMHQSKRARMDYHFSIEASIRECEGAAYEAESARVEEKQANPVNKWCLYSISQDVNVDYETCSGALVVASSEEEAKFMHPSGRTRGWWAMTTYSQNAMAWGRGCYADRGPMPGWYMQDNDDWVHPGYVKVKLISSFDGDKSMHGTCIASNYSGC
tara:strand:+ start:525 stop:1148 length:624 start_codon:yes stop_codon:yes gene_type:complete